jgi:hypothetical protein
MVRIHAQRVFAFFEFFSGYCATCCNQPPDQNLILSFLLTFFSKFVFCSI